MDYKFQRILHIGLCVLGILFGIVIVLASIGGITLGSMYAKSKITTIAVLTVLGIILGSFQILVFIMLLKKKKWAQTPAVAIGLLSILSAYSFPYSQIFGAGVIYYLQFDKKFKKYIKQKK